MAYRANVKRRRRRRRSGRGRSTSSVVAWTLVFLVLLNVAAVAVFEPVRDPLDWNSYLGDDVMVHFGAFFLAAAIGGPLLLRWFSLGITAVGLVGLGIAAEVVQAFSTDRTADFVDFVADEAGILAALLTIALLRFIHRLAFAGPDGGQGQHQGHH